MLYRGLSRYPGNEQNVEEFLIAACGKQPVEFIIDTKEIRTEILDLGRSPSEAEASEYRIAVKRSGRGYTRLKVTMSGSFLAPAASVLDGEDFIGDASSFVYRVERHRLHAGRNFGRITLQSPYQTTEIPVEIVYRRRSDGRARQEREARRTLLDMMRHYERLRDVWAAQLQGEQAGFGEGEWLRQADELVKRLSFLRRDSILPGLYAVQLLLMQNRVHQAVMELETIRRRLAEVKQGEVLEMGYVQYRGEVLDPHVPDCRDEIPGLCLSVFGTPEKVVSAPSEGSLSRIPPVILEIWVSERGSLGRLYQNETHRFYLLG